MSTKNEQILEIFFNNRRETLRIYDTRGPIVSFLGDPVNDICPLMLSTIKLGKTLGQGSEGEVFEIIFEDGTYAEYVAKKSMKVDLLYYDTQDKFDEAIKEYHISQKIVDYYLHQYERLVIPVFAEECLTTEPMTFPDAAGSYKTVTFPAGSYICENSAFSEYLVGLLAGAFYEKGMSINFIHTFSFATCKKRDSTHNYTFMQRIDGSINKLFPMNDPVDENAVAIQVLHAIATYQTLKISHNDLHFGNIMFERITPATMWKGERLVDYDFFEYIIGETSIYIPRTRILVKIADFGLAVKYSEPMVGQEWVVRDGVYNSGYGPWMPNKFSWSYDALVALSNFWSQCKYNNFISRLFAHFLDMPYTATPYTSEITKYQRALFNLEISRPVIGLISDVKPSDVLKDSRFMGVYLEKPRGKKILCIGKI